jgi:hypothetical protein
VFNARLKVKDGILFQVKQLQFFGGQIDMERDKRWFQRVIGLHGIG